MVDQNRGNILIVDDIPDNLRLLTTLLQEHHYKVRVVNNGPMALRAVEIEAPDLILLDIMMTGMDGYAVCQHLKANVQTRDIPIIFISALGHAENKLKGFALGAVDYVSRPFNHSEVLARVQTHLTLRRVQEELETQNAKLQQSNQALTQEIALRKQLEEELTSHRDHLEEMVKERTIEKVQLYEAERAAREQLRALARHLQTVREVERTRIARAVHDELGQMLTALKMDVAWLRKRLPPGDGSLDEKVQTALSLIDATIETVRRIATELRPGLLDDLGLVVAIEWQAQEFSARSGLVCALDLEEPTLALDRDLETAIFRIFQEILTNIARHAGASEVVVSLKEQTATLFTKDVVLTVWDNGKGITEQQVTDTMSLGLLGMRERARAWGGEITFQGQAGYGTTVTLRIPHPQTGLGDDDD